MDDAIGEIRPEDPSAYTMMLEPDGSVRMQLNCNRAMVTWSAAPASDAISGTFRFGPLATTKALLPVIASPRKTAGWHDLIRRESGGGMPPAYVRHRFDGTRHGESQRLLAEPTPAGTPLLDGDYSYATGFPLPPRPGARRP
jgi:hypothetical protein